MKHWAAWSKNYEQLARKCMVVASDTSGQVWNKMLLLLRIGRKEQALTALAQFQERALAEDPK